jgi:hypothetical protein
MVQNPEIQSIVKNTFNEVKNYLKSDQISVNCPRCAEENGGIIDGKFNLEINTKKNLFRCWKCSNPYFSGSLKKLLRLYATRSNYELYKSYVGNNYFFGNGEIDIDYEDLWIELPKEVILFSQMDYTNPSHLEAYNYLILDRKLNQEIIFKFRLGFCLEGRYTKRIIFPSYDENGIVNYFVARNYDLKNKKKSPYDNPKYGKDKIIFNEGYINWDSSIYLVEGVFELATFPINTIPLLGKKLSTTLFKKLNELKPNIVILLDPDAHKDAVELYYQLYSIYIGQEEKIKIIKLPYEKDLDLIRKNKGIDDVIKCLYNARTLTIDDYFSKKLVNLNDGRNSNRKFQDYSKYSEWGRSGSTKSFI